MTLLTAAATKPAGHYLVGVQDGWHAVDRADLRYAAAFSNETQAAQAACGALVRVAPKFGTYGSASYPVSFDPCAFCAWTVAIATGSVEAEMTRLTPSTDDAATLRTVHGINPLVAPQLCRAILAAAGEEDEPAGDVAYLGAVIRQLAAVSRHRPRIACRADDDETGGAEDQPGPAYCWECTLMTGDEAGEWSGRAMPECSVTGVCSVTSALARHYSILTAA